MHHRKLETARPPRSPGRRCHGRAVQAVACASLCLALAACVAGSAESHHAAGSGGVSQFVLGLWHGLIAPVTLLVEVVNRFAPKALPWTAHLFEASNTGFLYDIGFYLGMVGSPLAAASRFR